MSLNTQGEYLETLKSKREDVERRIKDRERETEKSNKLFLESIKKEIEGLEKIKPTTELRNQKFLEESKRIFDSFKNDLGKVYHADHNLQSEKKNLTTFLERNYPKLVNDLKGKLFREKLDLTKKIREMRIGGEEVAKLNNEIKQLSDDINLKRLELVEEEDKRIRSEQMFKNFMHSSTTVVPSKQNYTKYPPKLEEFLIHPANPSLSHEYVPNQARHLSVVEENPIVVDNSYDFTSGRANLKINQDFNAPKNQTSQRSMTNNTAQVSLPTGTAKAKTIVREESTKPPNPLSSKELNPGMLHQIDSEFSASGSYDNIKDLNFIKDKKNAVTNANVNMNIPSAKNTVQTKIPVPTGNQMNPGQQKGQQGNSLPFGNSGGSFGFKPTLTLNPQKQAPQNKPPVKANPKGDILYSSEELDNIDF